MTAASKDCFADESASRDVAWFNPADFDIADNSADAANATGWFYRGRNRFGGIQWQGPFNTSGLAAAAMQAKAQADMVTA